MDNSSGLCESVEWCSKGRKSKYVASFKDLSSFKYGDSSSLVVIGSVFINHKMTKYIQVKVVGLSKDRK